MVDSDKIKAFFAEESSPQKKKEKKQETRSIKAVTDTFGVAFVTVSGTFS